jgi:CheY-like chemotaxis protein
MDVMMPEMDGLAATRSIRTLPPPVGKLPIIGLTANALPADEAACLSAGMDLFAAKPIKAEQLAGLIAQAVAGCTPRDADSVRVENRGFDQAILDAMVRDVGADSATEIVRAFIHASSLQFADIQAHAASGDTAELIRHANTLARIARNVGLMRLGRAAAEFESATTGELPAKLLNVRSLLLAGIEELRGWRPPAPL